MLNTLSVVVLLEVIGNLVINKFDMMPIRHRSGVITTWVESIATLMTTLVTQCQVFHKE